MTKHTTFATLSTLSVVTLSLSSTALAQPAATTDPQTIVASPAPPVRPGADDPNVDRGFLLPTAMTQPAGSITYNNYELLLHGMTFGIKDNVQVTATVLSPIVKDMPFVGFGAIKTRIPVGRRVHLAIQGTVGVGHRFGETTGDANAYTLGTGVFASVCLREDCSSIASASASYQLALSNAENMGYVIIYGGSVVHAVSPRVKLLLEVASAANGGDGEVIGNVPGFLVSYGIRLHNGDMAADLGFVRPIGEDTGDFLMGLPFASVSYRWQ